MNRKQVGLLIPLALSVACAPFLAGRLFSGQPAFAQGAAPASARAILDVARTRVSINVHDADMKQLIDAISDATNKPKKIEVRLPRPSASRSRPTRCR